MLVGEPPQTRHLGTKCPIGLSAEPPLTGLFLIGASAGEIDKMVNIALRRHQLPHFLLRGAVSVSYTHLDVYKRQLKTAAGNVE